jgi:hypothetical protein
VPGLTDVVAIRVGEDYACALIDDGTAKCWGNRSLGELGTDPDQFNALNVTFPAGFASAPVPAPTVSGVPTAASNSKSVTATISGESGATFTCSVDQSAFAACQSPLTLTQLTEGQHSLAVRQTTTQGTSDPTSFNWTVDTIAPAPPSLSGTPLARTKSKGYGISISGEIGTTFLCSLDGAAYAECTSPSAKLGLAEGPHSFAAKAVDAAGNVGSAATTTWTVDLTPPAPPSLDGAPASLTGSTSQSISFTSEPGATFQCSLDGGAFSLCSSPSVRSGLVDGPHSIAVKAVDSVGNVGSPATASWTVNTTTLPPTVLGPAAFTNQTSATLTFSGAAGASFTCARDGGTFAACVSPLTLSALSDGAHSLAVKQIKSGLTSAATVVSWTIDRTPPSAPTLSGLSATITNRVTATVTFIGESGAAFACALDGASFAQCTAPLQLTGLKAGEHTFSVRQADSAGNQSQATNTKWVVDLTPPAAPTLTAKPAAYTNLTQASFSLKAANGATQTCSLDGAAPVPCSTSFKATGLLDGQHVMVATATDPASNRSSTTYIWQVDLAPPTLATRAAGNMVKTKTAITYVLDTTPDSSPLVSLEWSISASAPSATAKPVSSKVIKYTPSIKIKTTKPVSWLRIQDAAGNWSRWYAGT